MSVLEKDANEQIAVEKARRVEEERLTQQEKLYQVLALDLLCTFGCCKILAEVFWYIY